MRRGLVLLVAAVALARWSDPAAAAPLQGEPEPTIALTATEVRPGDQVSVILTGWPAAAVLIEICGAGATPGAVDACAFDRAASITTAPDRTASTTFRVVVPPGDCPCEVIATALSGEATATTPISIAGTSSAPEGPAVEQTPLVIEEAELVGGKRFAEWFGAPIRRTLVLTVKNQSSTPVDDGAISVHAGARGDAPQTFPVPELGEVAAGTSATVRIPVELPVGAAGSYRVQAKVSASSLPETRSVSLSTHPWGLIVVIFGGVAFLAVRLARLRRRLRRVGETTSPAADVSAPSGPTEDLDAAVVPNQPEPVLLEAP